MPLDHPLYQIYTHRFGLKQAIETLERDDLSSVDLRTEIGQSPRTESPFVEKFAVTDWELEAATTSILPREITTINDGNVEGSDGMDSFGRLVMKPRNLGLGGADALILQILINHSR